MPENIAEDEGIDCAWCDDDLEQSVMDAGEYLIDSENNEPVCQSCADDSGVTCRDCDSFVHRDDSHMFDSGLVAVITVVCEECFIDNYFYCESCEYLTHNNSYGADGMCGDCYDDGACEMGDCDCGECSVGEGNGIRPWGDAPDLKFHDIDGYVFTPRAGVYYLGMEIEIDGHGSRETVGLAMEALANHMWATTDATLGSGGVEVVTHPHSFDAWQHSFPWDQWTSLIHDNVMSQEGFNTNGIHIHISRVAFTNKRGKPLASHLYKFMQFIQVNQETIQAVAGRVGNNYCLWDPDRDGTTRVKDAMTDSSTGSYVRYRPVNTQNLDTIELRFFDGRTNPAFMKRCIQFAHSLVEFTRIGDAKTNRRWAAYTAYVRRYALRYPELVVYLNHNENTLLVSALRGEHKYKDEVLPRIKKNVAEKKAEETRLIRIEAEERELRRGEEIAADRDNTRLTANRDGTRLGAIPCGCDLCLTL